MGSLFPECLGGRAKAWKVLSYSPSRACLVFQVKPIRLDTVGRYAGRALSLGHYSTGGTLHVRLPPSG
jgi:hypothetical protein